MATDISADALALAAENRARTGLEDRVELVLGHLVAGLRGPFDLVVSNPPYVLPGEFEALEPEIRLYEPREAVVGSGQTGAVARRALEILRPGGWLVLECGDGKAADLEADLRALGYSDVEDLGRPCRARAGGRGPPRLTGRPSLAAGAEPAAPHARASELEEASAKRRGQPPERPP